MTTLVAAAALLLVSSQAEAQRDATSPGAVGAFAFQPRFGQPGAFIRVTWNRPDRVPSGDVLGYVIRRTDLFNFAQVVGGIPGDSSRLYLDSEATRTVTAFDGFPGDEAGAITQFTAPGLSPGQEYSYSVSAAYQNGLQDRDQDGAPDVADYLTPLSGRTRYITALAPSTIISVNGGTAGGAQVDASSFDVTWQQTPGADTYVIWVSNSPTFKKRIEIKGGTTIPVEQGGEQLITRTISAAHPKFRRATRLYVAVGARKAGDPKPRPFGAIFSSPIQVDRLDNPPNPPGQSADAPPPPPGGSVSNPPSAPDGSGRAGGRKKAKRARRFGASGHARR